MNTVEIDVFARYKRENEQLRAENAELRLQITQLEQRLQDLHGEYMLLRYKFKGMPTHAEVLKLRQEMLALKKELRLRGWSDTG
jgi:predicted nuclease with TOPRIM domain